MEAPPQPQHDAPTPESTPPSRQSIKGEILDFFKLVVLVLVLLLMVKAYVIEPFEVQGPSMIPTLHTGERILVFKLPHIVARFGLMDGYRPFDEGDIIVFDGPEADKRYVKRLIAQGPAPIRGNTVEAQEHGDGPSVRVRVERDGVYVNNRRLSEEYLNHETSLPIDEPRDVQLHAGEYFMMGDNRDLSKDSRSFGPIEENYIIGRAVLRFWPLDHFGILK